MPSSRQLAAIMFTDMVGYTALMQQNEQLAIMKRDRAKKAIEDSLTKYNGRLLQFYGDGTLSIFSSAVNAVSSAVEIQTLMLMEPKIDVRIGIHSGDVLIDDSGIYGDSVNVASRIESLAAPGGIFISEKVFDEVRNNETISAKPLGYFELKNVKVPMQVYAITNPGIVVPSRDGLKGKTRIKLNGIAVLPFTSGARLNVEKIIEVSVRKAGNKIRITAQLINAADGYHLCSATYDRGIEDIFAVQDEISRAIANKLRTNLTVEEHESQIAPAPTENLAAYKKYLQATLNWDSIQMDVRISSVALLQEAVALDPEFANALALLANIYSFPGIMGVIDAGEAKQLAAYHAEKAYASQPENPKALAAMAMIKMANWEWKETIDLLEKARNINPSEPAVYFALEEYYMLFLDFDKAAEVARKTAEVDPMSARTLAEAARIMVYIARPDEAIGYIERSLSLNPQNFLAMQLKGYVAFLHHEYDQAVTIFEENNKIAGDHPYSLLALALGYMHAGYEEKAHKIQQQIVDMHRQNPTAGLEPMLAYMQILFNEMDQFYLLFDKAVEEKNMWVIQMYADSFNKILKTDAHVIAARKKFGLPVWE